MQFGPSSKVRQRDRRSGRQIDAQECALPPTSVRTEGRVGKVECAVRAKAWLHWLGDIRDDWLETIWTELTDHSRGQSSTGRTSQRRRAKGTPISSKLREHVSVTLWPNTPPEPGNVL